MKVLFIKKTVLLLAFVVSNLFLINAQEQNAEKQKVDLTNGTVQEQFDYVINKSTTYTGERNQIVYKVVKIVMMNKLRSNVLDSLKLIKSKLVNSNQKIEEQKKQISGVTANLAQVTDKMNYAIKEKDSFSFLGMLISKTAYNTILWFVIIGLIIVCVFIFLLFKRSNDITIKIKESLNDKQEELDTHRKWALEREQKLARELNKIKMKYKDMK